MIPNKMILKFTQQEIDKQEKLFNETKNDKKNKKPTDDQEKFNFG